MKNDMTTGFEQQQSPMQRAFTRAAPAAQHGGSFLVPALKRPERRPEDDARKPPNGA
jgi:hypothetical protein